MDTEVSTQTNPADESTVTVEGGTEKGHVESFSHDWIDSYERKVQDLTNKLDKAREENKVLVERIEDIDAAKNNLKDWLVSFAILLGSVLVARQILEFLVVIFTSIRPQLILLEANKAAFQGIANFAGGIIWIQRFIYGTSDKRINRLRRELDSSNLKLKEANEESDRRKKELENETSNE